jgi:preprotein translocase subunit SecF
MKIIPNKAVWFVLSVIMLTASFAAIFFYGFRLSSDFTEGTVIAVQFPTTTDEASAPVTQELFRGAVGSYQPAEGAEDIAGIDLKAGEDQQFILRTKRLTSDEQQALLTHLETELGTFDLLQSRDVTPLYAKSFRNNSFLALGAAAVMIVLYITFAFRKVSRGIKSWKLGVAAIVALLHDIIIMLGVFAVLGYHGSAEVDVLFITAMLSIMGFSVHNTIVVFDRIRENIIHKSYQESFDEVAERSVQQTLARSINTSLTSLLVLIPLLVLGAAEIHYFVLALLIGIVFGTYTSIFVATPLLTIFQGSESK